jgi:hypothetical protein
VKTHQLTIFLSAPHENTIASLKADAFSALASDVNQAEGVPKITSVSDFELCRGIKERGRAGIVSYEVLGPKDTVKGALSNWESVFVQFRDESGQLTGAYLKTPCILMRSCTTNTLQEAYCLSR